MHKDVTKHKLRHFDQIGDQCWITNLICDMQGKCWDCNLFLNRGINHET